MHVVLYHPSIPPNTGNIGRLCVGMGAALHLIKPLGFELSEKALRRAGLDYWPDLDLTVHENDEAFIDWLDGREPWLVTKFAQQRYDHVPFAQDDIIVMGNEQKGLPDAWHERWPERGVGIPIKGPIRSYNLANACAIVLAQAQISTGFLDGIAAPKRES